MSDEMQEGGCCPERMTICLDHDTLQKLKMKLPKVGTAVTIQATGYVESAALYGGNPQAMLSITNLKVKLGKDMTEKLQQAANVLYGPSGEDEGDD